MCSPSPPPAPDPVTTANAQGAANEAAARTQGHINNPNVTGPGGSRTVSWNGDDATITNTLTPEEQAIYEQNVQNRTGLGGLANQGITSLQGTIGKPLDFSGAPAGGTAYQPGGALSTFDPRTLGSMPQMYQGASSSLAPIPQASDAIRQQVIDAQMARTNAAIDRDQQAKQAQLIAAGIRPGTEAYATEMDALNRQRNDARQQAEVGATGQANTLFGMDLARRQQGYQEGVTDASTKFGEGMQERGAAAGEQAQQFGQQGQAEQLAAQQQNQQYSQQMDARRQAISEILARRQVPLNEITALMSGSQTGGQGMGNSSFAPSTVAPAPVFGAQQANQQYNTDVYNAQVGQSNATTGALSSAAMYAIMMY